MNNKTIEYVHISQISVGNTIEHCGKVKTLSGNNLKIGGFCGTTIFSDSYDAGRKFVKRVRFIVPTNKGIIYR